MIKFFDPDPLRLLNTTVRQLSKARSQQATEHCLRGEINTQIETLDI